jgi:hypothetical protein
MYDIFRIHKFVNTRFCRDFANTHTHTHKHTHTHTQLNDLLTLLFSFAKKKVD